MNKYFILLLIACCWSCLSSQKSDSLSGPILIPVPSKTTGAEPYLFTDVSNQVYLSWVEVEGVNSALKFSVLNENTWSEPLTIAAGDNWFVNWADYPMLAANESEMIAHFLGKSGEGKFAYDVMTTYSHDGGKTWSQPAPINDDGLEAEHGFVSVIPYSDNYFISWLDGRNTVMEGMENHEGHHGQMSIRAAVTDVNGGKINEWELDNRTCDCCQTTSALTSNGLIVVYRDRSEDEIRDISIVRLVNDEWTAPQSVFSDNWKIAGCPVNGPRVDVIGNSVAIAWYTAAGGNAEVKVIFSSDGGASFGKPLRINDGETIGRVDLVLLDESHAVVSWMEGATIKAMNIDSNGKKGEPIIIAKSSESRSSGFPQMTRSGNQLIFAWTVDEEKNIKSAYLNLDSMK